MTMNERTVRGFLPNNWRFVGPDHIDPAAMIWEKEDYRLLVDHIGLFLYRRTKGKWQRTNGASWDQALVRGSDSPVVQFGENDRYPAVFVVL